MLAFQTERVRPIICPAFRAENPSLPESPNGMQTRQISNAGHRLDPPGWAEA